MKINTQVQLLVTFFKEFLLRVKSNTPGSTTVSNYLNQHFITTSSLQQFWPNVVNSLCRCGESMKYSINLSHEAQ